MELAVASEINAAANFMINAWGPAEARSLANDPGTDGAGGPGRLTRAQERRADGGHRLPSPRRAGEGLR
ncbi:hypothetical protein ACSNN7_07935 [Micromonospora sp. URMC 105]|uniref:hypothetical protein n=1 Tax=Micromonospora sp. URMC 105 TaxID=3423413 RepID=UPI003F1BFD30